jgi:serine protease AprX
MILGYGATFLAKGTTTNAGAGIVNVSTAMNMAGSALTRSLAAITTATFGTGLGSLELARGSSHVAAEGITLTGEKDIFGRTFTPALWAAKSLLGTAWTADGAWNGSYWTGAGFDATGLNWTGRTWVTASWTGTAWTGRTWVGRTWVANSWDASRWAGDTWTASRWVTAGWSSATWS